MAKTVGEIWTQYRQLDIGLIAQNESGSLGEDEFIRLHLLCWLRCEQELIAGDYRMDYAVDTTGRMRSQEIRENIGRLEG